MPVLKLENSVPAVREKESQGSYVVIFIVESVNILLDTTK